MMKCVLNLASGVVSFFMNRFRKLGFIHYNGGLQVHSSLPNVVPHEWLFFPPQFPNNPDTEVLECEKSFLGLFIR